jgi:hypothetical protein
VKAYKLAIKLLKNPFKAVIIQTDDGNCYPSLVKDKEFFYISGINSKIMFTNTFKKHSKEINENILSNNEILKSLRN